MMKTNEHGYCPACNLDLDGELIWDHFFQMTNDYIESDYIAEQYGATRTKGRWGKAIGLYDMERDRTTRWMCPDCGSKWGRNETPKTPKE